MAGVEVKRCGVRCEPPAVVIVYIEKGRRRRRTMPLRNLNKHSGAERVAKELKETSRHSKYLSNVPLSQVVRLVSLLQARLAGLTMQAALTKVNKKHALDPNEDLNKVDESTLRTKKALMEDTFEKNQKKLGDDDFKYDVEVDFDGAVEHCGWDSEDDDDGGF